MGMSSSGEIFFGVDFGEEDPRWPVEDGYASPPDDWEEPEWDEWLALESGLTDPHASPETKRLSYSAWKQYVATNAEYAARCETWSQTKDRLAKEAPVELLTYGDEEYGWHGYALMLKGTNFSNYQTPEPIPDGHFNQVTHDKIRKAEDWCVAKGLKFANAKWMLGSSRG